MAPKKSRFVSQRQLTERRGNEMGVGDWELYAQHRVQQTQAILDAAPLGGRACFLGAGNCNDLDLERLAGHFSELHLVDIDLQALQRATARQSPETQSRMRLHGGVELSGLLARLGDKRRPLQTFADIEAALQPATDRVLAKLPRDLDLAVSCCVTTQLYYALNRAVAADDPMLVSIRHAGIVVHLRTLGMIVKPGAPVLLVTDALSSDSYPTETLVTETDLVQKTEDLASQVRLFEAGSPIVIRRILYRDTELIKLMEEPRLTAAWLWTGPLQRTYLVYSMRLKRRITA
ncbi:MAG: hypothetical protein SGI86_22435 [Deltaproteobacteria bacterium]|nr:hypothetical protein [Deltaproteobacteria bacterium]